MKNYLFWIPLTGDGDTPQEAWENAIANMVEDGREFEKVSDNIFGPDEEIPTAEILGGKLNTGFGIDLGEEE